MELRHGLNSVFNRMKNLSSCQIFPILGYLKQITQCTILRKKFFRKERPKELLHEAVSILNVDENSYFLG